MDSDETASDGGGNSDEWRGDCDDDVDVEDDRVGKENRGDTDDAGCAARTSGMRGTTWMGGERIQILRCDEVKTLSTISKPCSSNNLKELASIRSKRPAARAATYTAFLTLM